jgi:hypothetical protein
VKFSVCPSILLIRRECSPLGINGGANITPRGQISPWGPGNEVKNVPQFTDFGEVAGEIRRRTDFRTAYEGNRNGVSNRPVILEIYSPNVIALQVRARLPDGIPIIQILFICGADVVIFRIFSPKNFPKKLTYNYILLVFEKRS